MVRVMPLSLRLPVSGRLAAFTSVSYEQGGAQVPRHPESYHHLLFPHLYAGDLPPASVPIYRRQLLSRWEAAGFFQDDPEAQMFLYRQEHPDFVSEGWILGVDVEEYRRNNVKKHEAILRERARQIVEYFDQVRLNGSPILLLHRRHAALAALGAEIARRPPSFSFVDEQDIRHIGWQLTPGEGADVAALFSAIPTLYIGDGHHRCHAYDKYYRKQKKGGALMACVVAEDQVRISSFHRLLLPLSAIEKSALHAFFAMEFGGPVAEYASLEAAAIHAGEVGVFTGDRVAVYALPEMKKTEVEQVDAALDTFREGTAIALQYVNSRLGPSRLKELSHNGALILLPPLSVRTVFRYADEGKTMPPKATWIEPKMRSGLFLHRIG